MSSPQPTLENPAPNPHTPANKRTLANQRNAQHSTGPRTEAGKRNSAQNSASHGLTATALLAEHQSAYAPHAASLRAQLRPEGAIEEAAFSAYAFATFQAQRARDFEARATLDYENALLAASPTQDQLLRRLDTLSKYRARHERSAAHALRQLGALQADRLAANHVNLLLRECGTNEPIPPALPLANIRYRSSRPNAHSLAQDFLFGLRTPSSVTYCRDVQPA